MPWKHGWTINMSQSGVLVALAGQVELRGDIEFIITLSRAALQGPGVAMLPDLHCRGQIVRHESKADGAWAIAANIRRQRVRAAGSLSRKR
jgi:hypothetical protein